MTTRIYLECTGGIEKNVPRVIVRQHEAWRVMANGDPEYRFFYPILTKIMDSFSCSPLNFTFYFKKAPKVPDNAEKLHKRDDITLKYPLHRFTSKRGHIPFTFLFAHGKTGETLT